MHRGFETPQNCGPFVICIESWPGHTTDSSQTGDLDCHFLGVKAENKCMSASLSRVHEGMQVT